MINIKENENLSAMSPFFPFFINLVIPVKEYFHEQFCQMRKLVEVGGRGYIVIVLGAIYDLYQN